MPEHLPPSSTAAGLMAAGRQLLQANHAEMGLRLIFESCELAPSADGWQTLYDGALTTLNMEMMALACERLEALTHATAEGRAHIAFLRAGPLRMAALLERLEDRTVTAPQQPPIPNRILYVLHKSLPHTSDGYSLRSHGIARAYAAAGGDMVCITRPGFPHDLPQPLEAAATSESDGITYHHISKPRRTAMPPAPHEHLAHASVNYLEAAAEPILRQIAQHRPAVVMAASNHITALPACLAARAAGLPFIYEVRGFWDVTHATRDPLYPTTIMGRLETLIETSLACFADKVVTLNTPMCDALVGRGVEPERIRIAPNACDTDRFAPRARDHTLATALGLPDAVPVIGYVGSFSAYEGLDDLMVACSGLRAQGHDFRLLLVGSEAPTAAGTQPVTSQLHALASKHGLTDRLVMPGRVSPAEIPAYYSLIDIAPFPRKSTPVTELVSPLKPLEAMAMQCAVTVSRVRALHDMVAPGRTALTFAPDAPESLCDVLGKLLKDPELRRRLGQTGHTWVQTKRSWKSIINIFEDLY
ncbi:glycosyltransferase family 4 protein [Sulfitobacter donghicola]|nr:glycosyltransferase family 4 protein [Sulfitobacter donghicola]KIN70407.1 WnmB protein [Sulfitobacter donghicola DSW-25 = KCTC 12864 = JCM 14565]